jgi:methyl-accepting chemotaxis protein
LDILRNIKLAARLGLGFGALIAILIVASVLGVTRLSQVKGHLDTIAHVNNEKIAAATAMRIAVNQASLAVREIVLLEDASEMATVNSGLQKSRANYDAAEEKIGKMFSNTALTQPQERALFDKIDELKKKTRPFNNQVVTLGLNNQNAEATKILMGDVRPLQRQWLDSLGELVDLEARLNQEATQAAEDAHTSSLRLMIAVSVVGVLVGSLFAVLITKSISAPIAVAVALAHRVASGDLSATVQVSGQDEAAELLTAMMEMQSSLARVVSTVRQSSESVATSSAEIAQGNHDLSARTEQQASALEETAASMEELSSQVQQNADNARQANKLAVSASAVAAAGGEVVSKVVDTMKQINDSSHRIADIISVIDGIAFQTNILALNAAVEAARAGEQGRGFAVVASEVRSLAGRSADAAKEIKSLIGASVERVEQGTVLVDKAGVTMADVVASIKRVTEIVAEISLASNEQAAGVSQVGEAVTQMDQTTQQNAALVEEMAAAASSLKTQAHELVDTVAVFQLAAVAPHMQQANANARSQAAIAAAKFGRISYSAA